MRRLRERSGRIPYPMLKMPHSQKWSKLLADIYGKPSSRKILQTAQTEYQQLLAAGSPVPVTGRPLRNNLRTRIFPGLAIFRALNPYIPEIPSRLAMVETLFKADFLREMSFGIRILNGLPDPFRLIRPVLRKMTNHQFLPGSQILVEDSPDCFALDTQRCFFLDVLTALDAGELTVIFCKTDDWLSELLPKVHWMRTKTLAQGDDCCDFRWCRMDP